MAYKENSKAEIIESAVQMSSICGLNGLSIGNLAESVKMTKGGIGAHFRSKADLQVAVIKRASEIFASAVILPSMNAPAGIERIKAFTDNWLAYLENKVFAGGCFFTNCVIEMDDMGEDRVKAEINTHYEKFIEWLEETARECVDMGQFKIDIDSRLFAFEMQGILMALIVNRTFSNPNKYKLLARRALDNMIERAKA